MDTPSPSLASRSFGVIFAAAFSLLFQGNTMLAAVPAKTSISALEADFREPPVGARPHVWWHWMGPNFSREGITKDLEAMERLGIGGATIFNLTSGVQESNAAIANNPWPWQTYRSLEYWEAVKHAAVEADRLNLELGLHNSVGYSTTGGPWIDEARSMQRLVWSSASLSGAGAAAELQLPRPAIPPHKGLGSTGRKLEFYRDIAVLAVPERADSAQTPPSFLQPSDVLDLTTLFDAKSDTLRWTPPPGRWIVYRFGHASTGATPHPVPDDLLGRTLEADKMSVEQTRFHWGQVLDPLKSALGVHFGHTLRHVLIDSYEAGRQNWTPGFREEFRKRMGYDPLPWLVTLGSIVTGERGAKPVRVLGDADRTARFERDYREVIATLFRENGWEPALEKIHAAGLRLEFEAYSGPFDTVAGTALADIPMVEFWTSGKPAADPNIVGAARAAGRNIIAAEAFTGRPERSQWTETPAFLKPYADRMFASGVNRMVLHHWVHQPFDDRFKPGMGMGWWGTHFGRNQTWAEPGREFFRYLGRVQSLLQRGRSPESWVSVGAAFGVGGDVIPLHVFLSGMKCVHGRIVLPSRREYPFVHVPHAGALEPATVRRIEALLEQGASVVARRPERSPSLSGWPGCDAEVRTLAEKLWGPANAAIPAEGRRVGAGRLFTDLAAAQRAHACEPVARVEPGAEGTLLLQTRVEGSTRIIFVANPEAAPARGTISCATPSEIQPELWDPETGSTRLAPLWRVRDGRIEVDVVLGAEKSAFVMLRQKLAKDQVHVAAVEAPAGWTLGNDDAGRPTIRAAAPLAGTAVMTDGRRVPFNLVPAHAPTFSGYWAIELVAPVGPRSYLEAYTLKSLSEREEPVAKYFSGTAIYRTKVVVAPDALAKGRRVRLDLGDVRDLVNVKVNGVDLGVLWHPPFACDVTDALQLGDNEIVLEVTNTWHNRLAGDEREPADFEWGSDRGKARGRAMKAYPDWFVKGRARPSSGRVGFSVWVYAREDTPLIPSGLLGPVRFVTEAEQVLGRSQ